MIIVVRGPTILRPQPWWGQRPFTLSYSLQYVNIETERAAVRIGRVFSEKDNLYKTNMSSFQVEKQMNFRLNFKYVNKFEVRPDLSS